MNAGDYFIAGGIQKDGKKLRLPILQPFLFILLSLADRVDTGDQLIFG
jgi:hypothetical protein